MNAIANVRKRLGVTQAELASALKVTQGNVWFYERGQTVRPQVAARLIRYARQRGLALTFDEIYAEHLEEHGPNDAASAGDGCPSDWGPSGPGSRELVQ